MERTSAKVFIGVRKIHFFYKEARLIQNNAATADATPQSALSRQRVCTGIPGSLRKKNLGKCQRITLDFSLTLTKSHCWRTRILMCQGKDQKVLLGAHISPLSHALPVGSKVFFNLPCKGDVTFLHRRDTLTRPNTSVTASCYLYYNLLSTQFVHLLHTPHIFTFHQRTPHKIALSGDKSYQTSSLKTHVVQLNKMPT